MKFDEPRYFDSERSLADLLDTHRRDRIAEALNALFDEAWSIVDVQERPLLGTIPPLPAACAPLFHGAEPIGFLIAATAPAQVTSAARLVQAELAASARHAMAATVQQTMLAEDYADLESKHAALLQSEARYRQLAEALEQRVQAQARTIEAAQRHLYEAERAAAAVQLAAGTAQDINAPISFLRSNVATAQRYVDELSLVIAARRAGDTSGADQVWQRIDGRHLLQDFATLLGESAATVERIARIVTDLEALTPIDHDGAATADVNDCVRLIASVMVPLAAGRAMIDLDLAPVPAVALAPGQLNQVLLHLVRNALAAVPAAGRVWLATRVTQGSAGAEVQLRVIDNGCGIDPAVLPRIFDPFFTTRDAADSVGLGLTISRDIVTACGGRIDVQSVVGRGSVFTVAMPANTNSQRLERRVDIDDTQ